MTDSAASRPSGFLAALSGVDTAALHARGTRRRYRRSSMIFNEGETSDRVVFVLDGRVKISHFTEDGREVVLAVRGPGDLLGELSAVDGEPRSASASAIDPVDALVISAGEFLSFLRSQPRVATILLKTVSGKLRDADRKRIEFAAQDTLGRVAARLVELAERFGKREGAGVRITVPLSQQELAGWTGSSREAVSKALQTLRRRGWVETHRRGVTVLELDSLRRRATPV